MELPFKLTLNDPVKHGDNEVKDLVFGRKMVAGDMRGIPVSGMKFDDMQLVIGRLCNQPQSVISQLSMPDWTRCAEVLADFFGVGQ